MMRKLLPLTVLLLITCLSCVFAQTYTPIAVTGFNHDVIAETGTSSLTTTTTSLDGVTVSNKVMYSNAFRLANGFAGGGVADNGTIVNGTSTYQLAAYNGNNALVLPRASNGDLVLTTPAKYASLRLLAFTTEGSSLINVNVFFTDGTSVTVLTNYTLPDWFTGTPNLVLSGFGRVTRATPASGADAFPTNPNMYFVNIPLSCTNMQKNVQRINIANVTTAGNNAPYPNAVVFAVSGSAYSQTITPSSVNATCTAGGSATVNVSGSTAPYTITWNTVPAQNGATASNVQAGNYTATISDAGGCITTQQVTVALTNNLTLTAHADTSICPAASFNANTVSNGTSFTWTPTTGVSNTGIASPIISATATTPYTVTATLGTNCTLSKTFTVTVAAPITLQVHIDTTICPGSSFNANTISNGQSIAWSPVNGVSAPNTLNPVLNPSATTPYTVTATTGACSVSRTFTVTVSPAVVANAGPNQTISSGGFVTLQGSGSTGTYLWAPPAGLSATNILTPVASPLTTTTYILKVTSAQNCSAISNVTVTVVPECLKPMNAITPNGDGVNDRWLVNSGGCTNRVKVNIYNRYGNRVYSSTDYKNDWQGTYKNKPVPDGTYYFVLEYTLPGSATPVMTRGDVTVIR